MKRLLTILFISVSLFASAQTTTQYIGSPTTKVQNKGVFQTDSAFIPSQDTIMRATWDHSKRYLTFKGDSLYLWSPYLNKYVLYSSGVGSGTVTSVGLTMPAAFTVSSSPVTGSGTIAVTGAGSTSQYIRGNGSLSTFSTDVLSTTSPYYSPLGHTHTASQITDFTTAVGNLFHAGTGLSYNPTTFTFSFTGGGSGSYIFSSPLAESSGTVSISQANGSTNGYLSATDWTAFNGKIGPSDTASMLNHYRHWGQGYLKAADIAGKLNISDTAAMLANYKHWGAGYTKLNSFSALAPAQYNNTTGVFSVDTTTAVTGLVTKGRLYKGLDSLKSAAYNFANTDLSLTGDRRHSLAGHEFKLGDSYTWTVGAIGYGNYTYHRYGMGYDELFLQEPSSSNQSFIDRNISINSGVPKYYLRLYSNIRDALSYFWMQDSTWQWELNEATGITLTANGMRFKGITAAADTTVSTLDPTGNMHKIGKTALKNLLGVTSGSSVSAGYGLSGTSTFIVDTTLIASKSFVQGMPAYGITSSNITTWNNAVPQSRTITWLGTSYDLSANRTLPTPSLYDVTQTGTDNIMYKAFFDVPRSVGSPYYTRFTPDEIYAATGNFRIVANQVAGQIADAHYNHGYSFDTHGDTTGYVHFRADNLRTDQYVWFPNASGVIPLSVKVNGTSYTASGSTGEINLGTISGGGSLPSLAQYHLYVGDAGSAPVDAGSNLYYNASLYSLGSSSTSTDGQFVAKSNGTGGGGITLDGTPSGGHKVHLYAASSGYTFLYDQSNSMTLLGFDPTGALQMARDANWSETTPGTTPGSISVGGTTATNGYGGSVTFIPGGMTTAQAGIYFKASTVYGTRMLFGVTNSFATGSQTAVEIYEDGQVQFNNNLLFKEITAPSTPATGYGATYAKSDGKLYYKNSAGTEYDLTASGSGGSSSLATLTDVTLTSLASGDFLKYNGTAWINRTASQVKTDISLNNVENTALSTWAGSSNITTLGTITTGTWHGTAIGDTYISSASTWNAKQAALVSGTNIKTVNGNSLLGSGDLTISSGSSTLASLTDASISSPANNEVLRYSTSDNKWHNSASTINGLISAGTNISITGSGTAASPYVIANGVTNNNQLTNGSNYITLTSLSSSGLIGYNNTTGAISFGGTLSQLNTAITDADVATIAGSETLTNKTLTSPTIGTILNTGTISVPTVSSTITSWRSNSITSSATPSPTGDARDNTYYITAQAAAATFAAPSGTPTEGNTLLIRIKDDGTSRALSWNAIYVGGTNISLPTATTISKTMYIKFAYNAVASTWDLLSVIDGR